MSCLIKPLEASGGVRKGSEAGRAGGRGELGRDDEVPATGQILEVVGHDGVDVIGGAANELEEQGA